MEIILGFGKTETDFEKQEFDFVERFIQEEANNFVGDKYDFGFSDELVNKLKIKLDERSLQYRKMHDEFKSATEYPDRYSTYYFEIVHSFSTLCVAFKFSHTSRRHPMSPDGWALLSKKDVYYADIWDFRE